MFAKEWLNAGRRQEGTPAGAIPDNRRPACIRLVVGLVPLFLCESAGCRSWPPVSAPQPPAGEILVRGQLTFYADFPLPRRHRLIDELVALRADITEKLLLPASDEPIQVYLFKDADQFRRFLWRRYPQLPDRRAFFVETDTRLAVFAHWGDRVAEDLRHELAHGYLHAVVPNLPLWLDEGLAEYFEVPRGRHGLHAAHVQLLRERHQKFFWKPALERLERFDRADQMGPLDFAEAWLVVHWLLETTELRQQLLQNYLARLRLAGESPRLVELLRQSEPDYEGQLLVHLVTLYPQIDPP